MERRRRSKRRREEEEEEKCKTRLLNLVYILKYLHLQK
jgi:hypothetical protein